MILSHEGTYKANIYGPKLAHFRPNLQILTFFLTLKSSYMYVINIKKAMGCL